MKRKTFGVVESLVPYIVLSVEKMNDFGAIVGTGGKQTWGIGNWHDHKVLLPG